MVREPFVRSCRCYHYCSNMNTEHVKQGLIKFSAFDVEERVAKETDNTVNTGVLKTLCISLPCGGTIPVLSR